MPSLSRTARLIIGGIIAFALLLGVLQVRSCVNARGDVAVLKVQGAQQGAFGNSAVDAIATQATVAAGAAVAEALTRTNEKEIRNAPGADARVDDRATAAGRDSLCRRAAYRDSHECRLRNPAPR